MICSFPHSRFAVGLLIVPLVHLYVLHTLCYAGSFEGFLQNSIKLEYFARHKITQYEVKPNVMGWKNILWKLKLFSLTEFSFESIFHFSYSNLCFLLIAKVQLNQKEAWLRLVLHNHGRGSLGIL